MEEETKSPASETSVPVPTPAMPAIPLSEPKKMRLCAHCGQPRELKSVWKELWRLPTMNEVIILFMIAMMLFASWAYKHDVAQCRYYIDNIDQICIGRNLTFAQSNHTITPDMLKVYQNLSALIGSFNQTNNNSGDNLTAPD